MEKIRIGVIGLSQRGYGLLKAAILPRENVEITAVCDLYEDRVERAAHAVEEKYGKRPFTSTDYREVCARADVDAVFISTAWEAHVEIAICSMENKKFTALEVGGAYSLNDCFRLVDAYERTGVQCMMMENCCYGRRELMVLNMVRQGLFGEIVHCDGAYMHDLRSEIAFGEEMRHYRLRNYMNRNCENYPTHEIGPIAKVLNLNRGNRMLSLTATASRSVGLHEYIRNTERANKELLNHPVTQGDVITTVIKCAHGETIRLSLNTTLPRFYTRNLTVCGSKGMFMQDLDCVMLDGVHNKWAEGSITWREQWGNAKEYEEKYEHPIWDKFLHDGVRGGHGGMDWLVFDAFFGAIEKGIEFPIDTYDTASWMAITPLSENSIAMGGAPVTFPDFTHGKWTHREPQTEWEMALL